MVILVSACLLGQNCKYNGGNNYNAGLARLLAGHTVVPVCPEVAGGLPVPRPPAEIVGGVVKTKAGTSVDAEYHRGAALCLQKGIAAGAQLAVLQSRSPSCGVKQIYDGSFTGTRIPGKGVFAALLAENAIPAVDVEDLDELAALLQQ